MSIINNKLGELLGFFMNHCYTLIGIYSIALIVFTLLTKIFLLPISIWVQKNSVKLVKMQPELLKVKTEYYGNSELISEKQFELYKKHKYNPFLDFIPLILQLILLMGVINAVYTPMDNILQIDTSYIEMMTDEYLTASGDENTSSVQISVINAVWYDNYTEIWANIPNDVLTQIKSFDMKLFSFINLAETPSKSGGILFIIPLLAAFSSWLMCFVQNKINVLQANQNKINQYVTMFIAVGLSLYLGCFVPAGVGWYWIWGNLLSIPQMFLLNIIINPKKYIDYEELESYKKEFEKIQLYHRNVNSKVHKDPNHKISKADYKKFLKYGTKQLVFYSEKKGFYKYYKKVIEYIIAKTDIVIHYITSDINDDVFELESLQFLVYYVDETNLIPLMMKMDSDIVVMTMPDLNIYHIKRSYIRKDIEYIFLPHSINSDNLALRTGALNHFDTLFAYGDDAIKEYREIEKVYNLKERILVPFGSALVDDMIENYNCMEKNPSNIKTILIAPSWQPDNIIDLCIDEVLSSLLGNGWNVILRPHPQYVSIFKDKLISISEKYKDYKEFVLQMDFSDNKTVYSADILITDWSSIAFEYSFTTLKPVIFINTPMKVLNPEYKKIDVVPIDIKLRSELGANIDVDKIQTLTSTVSDMLENGDIYQNKIIKCREQSIYNIGKSYIDGGKYIINRLIYYSKK